MPELHIIQINDGTDNQLKFDELLNEQELTTGVEVVEIGSSGQQNGNIQNNATIFSNLDAKLKKRLKTVPVPSDATVAIKLSAPTPVPIKAAKDAFLRFISPLMDNHEPVSRAEVGINGSKVEVVLLREAEPFKPVFHEGAVLTGTDWPWTAQIVGEDIVVQGAKTTAFGGSNDNGDKGGTSSGFSTKGHPTLMGCALPLDGYAKTKADKEALDGTPLPHMPFGITNKGVDNPAGAHVEVTDPKTGRSIIVPVIDLGPAKNTGHALDLTEAAARFFKSTATANNFSMVLNYRLIKGALALPANLKPVVAAPPAAVPNASVKMAIVGVAMEEWNFWGRSTPGSISKVESDPQVLAHIESYWAIGVGEPKPGDFHTRWSAAFISYCMRKGGAGARFFYNERHSRYIKRAIDEKGDQASSFWGHRLDEYPPKVGDVVCWASEPGVSYDNQKGGEYSGHCDIVVAVNSGDVEIIGGNVSQSVTRSHLAINGQGCLKPSGNTKYLIAVIQNRLA